MFDIGRMKLEYSLILGSFQFILKKCLNNTFTMIIGKYTDITNKYICEIVFRISLERRVLNHFIKFDRACGIRFLD